MTQFLLFALGLGALVLGAEALVRGASRLALSLGISPLVVGLTIVAFGTSAPELAVSISAVLEGRLDITTGNVVGSNVFNVLFILGLAALVAPLVVHAQIIRQEVPIMIGASVLVLALGLDGTLGRLDAGMLFALFAGYTVFLLFQSRAQSQATRDEYAEGTALKGGWDSHWAVQALLVAGGLALLVLGSEWLVSAAVAFARALGVSDLIIGLTIVAAGTSMPEVATSVMAAARGQRDIAVGNVVGSSTFNLLGVLGISGLFAPEGLVMAPSLLRFDLWVMIAAAVACVPVFLTGCSIARWEGAVFLGYYAAYAAYLILAAAEHDALGAFSGAMMGFVLPITIVTLVVVLIRPRAGEGR